MNHLGEVFGVGTGIFESQWFAGEVLTYTVTRSSGTATPTNVELRMQLTETDPLTVVDSQPVVNDVAIVSHQFIEDTSVYYVEVRVDQSNALIVGSCTGPPPVVRRVSGANRYETAVAVSASTFEPGVTVAFIASGVGFPDALAGGPAAAASGGPVLLTGPSSLHPATAAELDRLDPERIVILGGQGAVSDVVAAQLANYTAGTVTRVAGGDRYATAAAISAETFQPGAFNAFVASGLNFPDALSGAAAAGELGSPVLLTRTASVPGVTLSELARLAPQQIVVLGGPGAISEDAVAQLELIAPTIRVAGPNRTATAIAIAIFGFTGALNTVFLATDRDFPDALAAGSPAGMMGAPVFLTGPTCVPAAVLAEIARRGPAEVVVLGGPNALSDAVLQLTSCT